MNKMDAECELVKRGQCAIGGELEHSTESRAIEVARLVSGQACWITPVIRPQSLESMEVGEGSVRRQPVYRPTTLAPRRKVGDAIKIAGLVANQRTHGIRTGEFPERVQHLVGSVRGVFEYGAVAVSSTVRSRAV